MTYFELFNLSPRFDVDLQQLKTAYRQLQAIHHPDKAPQSVAADLPGQPSHSRATALQHASHINQAYQTLSHADSRAAYLLKLQQQDGGLEHSIGDLDFLQHALELREQLDEAQSPEQLDSLRTEVEHWLESLCREFGIDYDQQDWLEARDTTRKLRFIQRVLLDIDKARDRFDDILNDDLDEGWHDQSAMHGDDDF